MRITADQKRILAILHRYDGEVLPVWETDLTERVAITASVAHGFVEVVPLGAKRTENGWPAWGARLTQAGIPIAKRCANGNGRKR